MIRRRSRAIPRPAALALGLALAVAACGGTASPAPSTIASDAAVPTAPASVAPASVAPASVAPSLAPSPSTSAAASLLAPTTEQRALIEAAVVALNADPFVGRVAQEATAVATTNGQDVEILASITADLNGDDVAFVLTVVGAGQDSATEVVVLDGVAYIREAGGSWQTAPGSVVADAMAGLYDNLSAVKDPAALGYAGKEIRDGRPLNHLVGVGEIAYAPANGGTGRYDAFHLWVLDDGTPVRIEAEFSATANGTSAAGTYTMTFADIGGPIEIVAPAGAG